MSVMFSEELDKLRTELADAQSMARHAEREQDRFSDMYHREHNRAEVAERLAAEREEELKQMRFQLRQVRNENLRISQLESQVSDARTEARDVTQKLKQLTDTFERQKAKLHEVREQLSWTVAQRQDLLAELEPTRVLLGALHSRFAAESTISTQLERLFQGGSDGGS